MEVLRRSFRLLRRPNFATVPAPMHRLSCYSRAFPSLMASPARWCPPGIGRGGFPLMAAPNPPVRRVFRSPLGYQKMASGIGIKGEELGNQDRGLLIPSANGNRDITDGILGISDCELDSDEDWVVSIPFEGKFPLSGLSRSRHHDGSLYRSGPGYRYRGRDSWKEQFCIANRNETRLEAMKLSDPVDCVLCDDGTCVRHSPRPMLQIFSVKLDKIHVDSGLVELYGYIAIRDGLDPLLNHVVNFSRDDPIIVEQGSLIKMAGPKRGIELIDTILVEYDMRIKTGKQEKDDLQLIDGVSDIDGTCGIQDRSIFTRRIYGESGIIEITGSRLSFGVEATVEAIISEVYSSFNLHLTCFTSGLEKEIRLFDGDIGESGGLKRSVIAVMINTSVDFKLKVASESSRTTEHCCSFMADQHGSVSQEIKTDPALISVKVTWSTLPRSLDGLFPA